MAIGKAIRLVFKERRYWFIAFGVMIATATLYYGLIRAAAPMQWMAGTAYKTTAVTLFGLLSVLFGLNISLLAYKFRQMHKFGLKETGASVLGVFTGSVGAGCPVCGAVILSFMGVTAGLSIFPLKGLEVQALGVALLGMATFLNARSIIRHCCMVKEVKQR